MAGFRKASQSSREHTGWKMASSAIPAEPAYSSQQLSCQAMGEGYHGSGAYRTPTTSRGSTPSPSRQPWEETSCRMWLCVCVGKKTKRPGTKTPQRPNAQQTTRRRGRKASGVDVMTREKTAWRPPTLWKLRYPPLRLILGHRSAWQKKKKTGPALIPAPTAGKRTPGRPRWRGSWAYRLSARR